MNALSKLNCVVCGKKNCRHVRVSAGGSRRGSRMTKKINDLLVSPPGDTLEDALKEQGLTQAELADRTGLSRNHVSNIIRGLAPIDADTAMRLESVVGGSVKFWLAREAQYRAAKEALIVLREAAE